jgi:hypothetical protein
MRLSSRMAPKVLARQHASSGEPGPEALENLIRDDAAKWRAIVDASQIKLN